MIQHPKTWRIKSLEEVADVRTGLAKGKSDIKDPVRLPYLRVANVQDGHIDLSEVKTIQVARAEVERYRLHARDVLLTEGGDLDKLGRGHIWDGQVDPCLHQNHVFAVRLRGTILKPEFLALLTTSSHGRRYFLGCAKRTTNLASINATQVRQFPVLLPPIQEQEQLCTVISTFDAALAKLTGWLELARERKRGLMQQLLTGQTRFKEFKGERWRRTCLAEIVEQVTRRNSTGCHRVLTGSANHGLIDQREYYNRRVASDDVTSYYLVKRGEFAYNRSTAIGYPFGAIKRLNEYDEGVLSTLYLVFRIKNGAHLDSNFLDHAFESGLFNSQLSRLCREGARSHGLLNITSEEFFSMHITLPGMSEQQRIEGVLSTCDREIALLQKQLDALKEQKRGLMQKLLTGEVRVKVKNKRGKPSHPGTLPQRRKGRKTRRKSNP